MITLDELKALDDAAFNRAIAELDGNKLVKIALEGGVRTLGIDTVRGLEFVPDYATDINAAWALFPINDTTTYEIARVPAKGNMGRVIELNEQRTNFRTFLEYHAHPARALATAWAAWKLAQEANA